MSDTYSTGCLGHVAATRRDGDAAFRILTRSEFADARAEITAWEGYEPTPLVSLSALASDLGVAGIHYKDEGPRFGLGSFKALGGAYAAQRVLQREVGRRTDRFVSLSDIRRGTDRAECERITLVSATDGNHGRSLAWGCRRFGASCRIYIHAAVSPGRADAMSRLGARVVRIDGNYDDSVALAGSEAAAHGWFVVSDTSWPGYSKPPCDVMAGYGVMTDEICAALEQPPTHVFLQAGVGGLAASVAARFRQHWGDDAPRVIVVEPERAACLFSSAMAGAPKEVTIVEETLMAGLSCGRPSDLAWEILAQEVSDFLTIPDFLVAPAVRLLAMPKRGDPLIEAGESAVAGLAALLAAGKDEALSVKLGLDEQSRVLLIGSEGVTDREIFSAILEGRNVA